MNSADYKIRCVFSFLYIYIYISLALDKLSIAMEVNSSSPNAAYTRQWIGSALVQIMACRQAIIETNAALSSIGPLETNFSEI